MLTEKISMANTQTRIATGLNMIKMDSFFFSRQKIRQEEELKQGHDHKSLRIRFKSDASKSKQKQQENNKHILSGYYGSKELSNSVTFRIMKWSKLKNKNQINKPGIHGHEDKMRRRSEIVQKSSLYNLRNISLQKCLKRSIKRLSPKSKESLKSNEQTMRIIDNYKLTQRIVFFQQLQQKKDRQKYIQNPKNRFGSALRPQQLRKEKPKEIPDTSNKAYRPWSGESVHSIHNQQ